MSNNLTKTKNQRQKLILVGICAIAGILLIILGGERIGAEKSVAASELSDDGAYGEESAKKYAEHLEDRIASICSEVRGVGEVSVFVSLSGGYRTLYATDAQSGSSGYKSEIVLSGSGSDRQAVVSAYQNPEIGGVAIVCDGAGSAAVRAEIIGLVSAALGISTNKIFVAGR